MNKITKLLFLSCLIMLVSQVATSQSNQKHTIEHPSLILTKDGVEKIRKNLGKIPLFDASLASVKAEMDAILDLPIEVPVPKDMAGGYTHETHKKNFIVMQKMGVLYQILDDERYANFLKEMFFKYEALYPTLGIHPQERSYARGKLFWQCLNDSNWLVYASQAYDCIYNYLSKKERAKLEKNLFKPYAEYLSTDNPQFFNRIHNHSTWGNAAVGMIALAMEDDELLDRALYGMKGGVVDENQRDNDGGFIRVEGQKAGFIANLNDPFSPDGYYTEGPYYQRYAMYPFLIFATALHNAKPELKIYEYKDSVLLKSVHALLNLTDKKGDFFPINDAQKGMSYYSRELVSAVDIAYHFGDSPASLLSIAKKQNKVTLDDAGLSVALGISDGKAEAFKKKSILLSDGASGDEGGIGIIRYGDELMTLVFKYSAQGLSHGHYDKLSYSIFEDGTEVLQDYGLVRYVNIEQKNGGGYLKENTTWGKQTIAHNTLIVNETSHFGGKYEIGSKHHSELYFNDFSDEKLQVISAKETNAYEGTDMHRTMLVIKEDNLHKPFILDLMRVSAEEANQYDLPFHYHGQIMDHNIDIEKSKTLEPLGEQHGYQHLWKEASGTSTDKNARLSWLLDNTFYTITSTLEDNDELLFARTGANDPSFNLRTDPSLIIRRKDTKSTLFASIIESHGTYSPVSEFAVNATSNIKSLDILLDQADYTAVQYELETGEVRLLVVANKAASKNQNHQIKLSDKTYNWKGPYKLLTIK